MLIKLISSLGEETQKNDKITQQPKKGWGEKLNKITVILPVYWRQRIF